MPAAPTGSTALGAKGGGIIGCTQCIAKKPMPGKKGPGGSSQEEQKVVFTFHAQGPYTQKPSAKLTSIKTADPFATTAKKHKTAFGYVYTSGGVPCRINHGGVNNRLDWDKPPVGIGATRTTIELPYDPLLLHCFEGIVETEHPYSFVAFQALKEMLQAEVAFEQANGIGCG